MRLGSVAGTLLNEQGFSPDVIDLQLAHKDRNVESGAAGGSRARCRAICSLIVQPLAEVRRPGR